MDPARLFEVEEKPEARFCRTCGTWKTVNDFHRRGTGWQPKCKGCARDADRKRPRRMAADARRSTKPCKCGAESLAGSVYCSRCKWERRIWSAYGITATDYDSMFEEQGGRCAICRMPETSGRASMWGSGAKRLAVDHCHVTGRVAGLLCERCNKSLGGFREDPEVILAAARYAQERKVPLSEVLHVDG